MDKPEGLIDLSGPDDMEGGTGQHPTSSVGGDMQIHRDATNSVLTNGTGNIVLVININVVLPGRPTATETLDAMGGGLGPNPYRDLHAFDETSSAYFYGRETQTKCLLRRVEDLMYPAAGQVRLLAVMGPSGSGKSSVVRAGLVPALVGTTVWWLRKAKVVVLRPGETPVVALAAAIVRLGEGNSALLKRSLEQREDTEKVAEQIRADAKAGKADTLSRFAALWGETNTEPLVVVVDQFEEVYTSGRPADQADAEQIERTRAERRAFVDTLLHAATEPGVRVCVVLTLRSDFYGALAEHPKLSKEVANSHEIVPAMDRNDLRLAIAEPARKAGGKIDEPTVLRIIDAAESSRGAALPLVQFVMCRIWEGWCEGTPHIETLEKLIGPRGALPETLIGALARHADKVLAALPSEAERALAQRAFLAVVQPGEGGRDTSRRAWLEEILPAGVPEAEAQVRRALDPFVKERLLVMGADSKTGNGEDKRVWLELPHEAVIRHWQTLAIWVEKGRDDMRFGRRAQDAAEAWRREDRAPGCLWRPPDLNGLRKLATSGGRVLTALQEEFLTESEQQVRRERQHTRWAARVIFALFLVANREQRRARWAAGIIFVLFAMTSVLAVYGWDRAEEARGQRAAADTQRGEAERRAEEARNQRAAADTLRGEAERRTAEVEEQRELVTRTLAAGFASAADRETGRGDAATGLLLALQPLLNARANEARGETAETERAAYAAWLHLREKKVLGGHKGHKGSIYSVAFSPDGEHLATGSQDGTARLWDMQGRREPLVLPAHGDGRGGPVLALVFSPASSLTEQLLATASWDGTARLWDMQGRLIAGPVGGREDGRGGPVTSLALSPDGRYLATGSQDGTVRLWDMQNGGGREPLGRHNSPVRAIAFSPASSPGDLRFATGSGNGEVWVWDERDGRLADKPLGRHEGVVTAITFSPDGEHLATGSQDGTARLWDAGNERLVDERRTRVLDGRDGWIIALAFSPDGERLATGSQGRTARLWDARDGRELAVMREHDDEVLALAFSPDGERLATASWDGAARLWDARDGRKLAVLRGHESEHGSQIFALAFSPDSKRLATGSQDRTARLWDVRDDRRITVLTGHGGPVTAVAFSPDSKRLATGSQDRTARSWDVSNPKDGGRSHGRGGQVRAAALTPDGRLVAAVFDEGATRLWEMGDKDPDGKALDGQNDPVISVAFSPDGSHLATGSRSGKLRVWDTEGHRVRELPGEQGDEVRAVAVSPDGRLVAAVSADGTARLWGTESAHRIPVLDGHGGPVTAVAFSPDGSHLATGSRSGEVRVWDAKGRWIGEVRVWDTKGRRIGELPSEQDKGIRAVAVSPDGRLVATVSTADAARAWLWDTKSARRIAALDGHRGPVTAVAFSPDGNHLATGSQDRTARLWTVFPSREKLKSNLATALRELPRCSLSEPQQKAAGLGAYGKDAVNVCETHGASPPVGPSAR